MIKLETVIKLSGFCNFRCAYCYEFERLSDPTKMSEELLVKIAKDVGEWCEDLARRSQSPVQMTFVLHGGEPLVLPLHYLERVIATLRSAETERVSIRIGVQTNAYKIKPAVLDLLVRECVSISVSHDVVRGSRVSAGGKEVVSLVSDTVSMLNDKKLLRGGITVVNRQTLGSLINIHKYWRAMGVRYMLLPLDKNSGPQPELYGVSINESVSALAALCSHLLDEGQAIDMYPLKDIIKIALVHISGFAVPTIGRLDFGRAVFVINTDGRVYEQTATDYAEESMLGDLTKQAFAKIVSGKEVSRLHQYDNETEVKCCTDCTFRSSCSRWPLFVEAPQGERCGIYHVLTHQIVNILKERGVTQDMARSLLGTEAA